MNSFIKKTTVAATILAATQLTGCISPSSIDAGEEGVLIYKPWIWGHGGIDPEPMSTGLEWTVWSTEVARYNIKPVKRSEKFIDLTASDNVAIDFNAHLTTQVISGETPRLHEQYGYSWYENKVKDVFRTMVRNAARGRSSIELRTNEAIINETQEQVLASIKKYLKDENIPVNAVKVVFGKVVPPEEVLKEAERTASQKQREKTQDARAKAELNRKNAETNAALADKAYTDSFKMTTEQFLKNKELDIMLEAIKRGNNVSIIMNASDAVMVKGVK